MSMFNIDGYYLDAAGIAESLQDAAMFETAPVEFNVSWCGHSDGGADYQFRFGKAPQGCDAVSGSVAPGASFDACLWAVGNAASLIIRYYRH